MKWGPEKIKSLRQRLGWSAADFSRHFGVTALTVLDWESGASGPTQDNCQQLERLEFYRESYSAQVVRSPFAESALKNHKLSQIGLEQLKILDT